MANQRTINQGDINDNTIKPTWGTFERQEEYDKEDRFIAIVESISKTVANKADINHDHDDRYYTEPEIDADVNQLEDTTGAIEEGIAIICRNNIHPAIKQGEYVYIRTHETLSEGLYKATSDIALNAELSDENVVSASGALNDKLSLSGGTMTGDLNVKNYDLDNTDHSRSTQTERNIIFYDKNDKITGVVGSFMGLDGEIITPLIARRFNGDSAISNYIYLKIDKDLNQSVSVSNSQAWRTAISAVNKAGDTMTGGLTVQTGGVWVQGGSNAGGNNTRMGLTSGMPDAFPYNQSKRGTKIYSNAIAFADPLNGNTNNDAGWVRHIEESGNSGTLEIAVGDDGNESVVVRQYNTSSAVVRTLTLLDASGNSLFPGSLTMSGEINTSFKGAVAVGSRAATSGTVPNLVAEVRYSSGTMGSAMLSAYTSGSITIPGGWYNYLYIPHRSGGKNGAANQDNHNFGTLLLFGMTMDTNPFVIRVSSGAIAAIRKITVTTS